jgi:hypothetical protein
VFLYDIGSWYGVSGGPSRYLSVRGSVLVQPALPVGPAVGPAVGLAFGLANKTDIVYSLARRRCSDGRSHGVP